MRNLNPLQILKLAILLFSTVSAMTVTASEPLFPVLQCPSIGQEYEQLVAKLDALKAAIKSDANCKDVTLKIEEMQSKMSRDRELIVGLVEKGSNSNLSEAEARAVRDYAEDITKKVATLQDLFMQTNQCFAEDKREDSLKVLGSFVGEAATWVSSLAGPWGTPIAIAGNVIAGFLTGMDQIFRTRAGYDFTDRSQWQSYVTNLCTFYTYQDQIDHLLNPQVRAQKLEKMMEAIDHQIDKVGHSCKECGTIQAEMQNSPVLDESEWLNRLAGPIASADNAFGTPLGSLTAQFMGIQNWIRAEILRIEKESQSYWGDVSGRHVLRLANNQLSGFLVDNQAPKFFQAQVQYSRTAYAKFLNFSRSEGYSIYDWIAQVVYKHKGERLESLRWTRPNEIFTKVLAADLEWNKLPNDETVDMARYRLKQFREKGLELLDDTRTSVDVLRSFCSFFKYSGQYSRPISQTCTDRNLQNMIAEQDQIVKVLKEMSIYVSGPKNRFLNPEDYPNVKFSLNRIDALEKKINAPLL